MPDAELVFDGFQKLLDSQEHIEELKMQGYKNIETRFSIKGQQEKNVNLSEVMETIQELLDHDIISDFELSRSNLESVYQTYSKL